MKDSLLNEIKDAYSAGLPLSKGTIELLKTLIDKSSVKDEDDNPLSNDEVDYSLIKLKVENRGL
jgi:hypothetical protein